MDLYELLQKYKDYSFHNSDDKVEIKYKDTAFSNVNFSGYDLNNTEFLEVSFQQCDFSDVYLSGSNLSGSVFTQCKFNNNIFRKGQADYVSFIQTSIKNFDSFRTEYYKARFCNLTIESSDIKKCFIRESSFDCVDFKSVNVSGTNFQYVHFNNVKFIDCVIGNSIFENVYGLEKVEIINCKIV